MPNFYVVSDIHGFYNEFREALDKSGFDPNDKNSWLVSLGDETDRGPDPEKVIDYLMNLPQAIFIRGNHTDLMEELLKRGYPLSHDYHNGTFQSVLDLAPKTKTFKGACVIAEKKLRPFFDKELNYLELRWHILVHSFIPLKCNDDYPFYYTKNRKFEYDPNWRNAHASAFETARWGNPFALAVDGFLPEKKLIFGHYHTSWIRQQLSLDEPEFGPNADFSIYYGDGYIGIDGCTAYSKRVNILKIEDEFINNEY